jgi:hypothetical protein
MATANWLQGVSNSWTAAGAWSDGAVPTIGDDVTIAVAPTSAGSPYEITLEGSGSANSVVLDQAEAALVIGFNEGFLSQDGDLTVATDFDLQAGTLALTGGTLTGGTYVASGGTLALSSEFPQGPSNEISGVTWDGSMNLASSVGQSLLLSDVSFNGVNGTGPGALVAAAGMTLGLAANNVLSNVDVTLGSGDFVEVYGSAVWGLAANASIGLSGAQSTATLEGTIFNAGSISVSGSLADLTLTNGGIINGGTLSIGAGATLTLAGETLDNVGVVTVASGGAFVISYNSDINAAEFSGFQVSNGASVTVTQGGTITNLGTFAIGAGGSLPSLVLAADGVLEGGTITTSSGLVCDGGTLSGVTFAGPLTLGYAQEAEIVNGLTLVSASGSGPGSIALTGIGADLLFVDAETLSNATISIGNASTYASVLTAEADLSLASSVLIQQTGANAQFDSSPTGTLSNAGTIVAAQSGGTLTLAGYNAGFNETVAGNFNNTGVIEVSNGETLNLNLAILTNTGTIEISNAVLEVSNLTAAELAGITLANSALIVTGELNATGATLDIGAGGTLPAIRLNGGITGGTLHDAGGGLQVFGTATLSGVTFEGELEINRPLAYLNIQDGLTVTNLAGTQNGTIALTGAGSTLNWDSTQAFDNATLLIGANPGLGAPTLANGYGSMTLGSHLIVDQTGTAAAIGNDTVASYVSGATINATAKAGEFVVSAGSFTTTGAINIGNTETFTSNGTSFTNAGTIAIASGGNFVDDDANFTNTGRIVVGAGSTFTLDLNSYFATPSLQAQSFINSGSMVLKGGSVSEPLQGVYPSVPFLDAAGAQISGFGTVASAVVNNGVIAAAGGTLTLSQAASGTGTLQVDAGATLKLSAVSHGETVRFSGANGVLGLAPVSFLGTIAGFAAGDTIDMSGVHAISASFSGRSILVTVSPGHTFRLFTTSALTGSLTVTAGTHNDTLITFATTAHAGAPPVPAGIADPPPDTRLGHTEPSQSSVFGEHHDRIWAGQPMMPNHSFHVV